MRFDPTQPITCITGPNAQGKTNILEAIYLLALTKSFRASHNEDMIMWNEDYCRAKGELLLEGDSSVVDFGTHAQPGASVEAEAVVVAGAHSGAETGDSAGAYAVAAAQPETRLTLEVFFGQDPHPKKNMKKNNVKISNTDFVGNCQIVFFHPEDLNMLYLGPDLRRRYLDILNIQISRKYFHALKNYKRILQQRNFLLKEIKRGFASAGQLEIWNEQMIENGSVIIMERAETVRILNENLAEKYGAISEKNEPAEMKYQCALGPDYSPDYNPEATIPDTQGENFNLQPAGLNEVKTHFALALKNSQKDDLNAGITTVGPHRDDLLFLLNGRQLACHASRGEYRSLLLTLKLLELKFFKDRTGEKPLLLLDDVFSELDEKRQMMLLNSISGYQTVITSTHFDQSFEALSGDREHRAIINRIQVRDGKCAAST